jgi:hypothetical protein
VLHVFVTITPSSAPCKELRICVTVCRARQDCGSRAQIIFWPWLLEDIVNHDGRLKIMVAKPGDIDIFRIDIIESLGVGVPLLFQIL